MPVWFLHNYSFVIAPPWDLVVFQADLHASVLMPCILGHYAPLRRATKAKACLKNNKSHKGGRNHLALYAGTRQADTLSKSVHAKSILDTAIRIVQ